MSQLNWTEKTSKATQMDWVRLAAFIDGEGSIVISHYEGKGASDSLSIQIANTDPRLPEWCHASFGGYLTKCRNRKWRPLLAWHARGELAAFLLRECLPFLLLKKEQAEIALTFQTTKKRRGNWGGTRFPLSQDVLQEREQLRIELKRLKRVTMVDLPIIQ